MSAFRLTSETISQQALEEAAVEKAGLLGAYTLDEFELLTEHTPKDWTFEWVASKMDNGFGRVKMRPKTPYGAQLLDQGRAKKLLDRHPDLSLEVATEIIRCVKRHSRGMDKRVQDMAIRHCARLELYGGEDNFTLKWKKHVGGKLTPAQIEAIGELIGPVYNAIYTENTDKSAHPPRDKRDLRRRRRLKSNDHSPPPDTVSRKNDQHRLRSVRGCEVTIG